MEKKLTRKDYLYIGSMLFGLFFGAGNLIFPVNMGQNAGGNIFMANLGFIITGVGLPFLGVIAVGISQSNGVYELAQRVNKKFAFIFTILLYLIVGPFFALPRLATTSYAIGVAPFVNKDYTTLILAIFSIIFFYAVWSAARTPSKILDYIGKYLNPLFLVLLGLLLFMAFIKPMGPIAGVPVQEAYVNNPLMKGFTNGYNTLDALAALAYSIVVMNVIKSKGIEKPSAIAKDTVKAGVLSVVLMTILYTLLSFMGTMSLGKFPISQNGGIALAEIANYYLGTFGAVLLAAIVIVACLKTSIGIVTAFSETFEELFPKRSYAFFVASGTGLACLFANVGLDNIIAFSTPVLFFIYPLAMVLILLTLIGGSFKNDRRVYEITMLFTVFPAIIDALKNSPQAISNLGISKALISFGQEYLPFFDLGMSWVLPAFIGFILGLIWVFIAGRIRKNNV